MANSSVSPNNLALKFRAKPNRERPRPPKLRVARLRKRGLISDRASKKHLGV